MRHLLGVVCVLLKLVFWAGWNEGKGWPSTAGTPISGSMLGERKSAIFGYTSKNLK